jgi:hypothetical protein
MDLPDRKHGEPLPPIIIANQRESLALEVTMAAASPKPAPNGQKDDEMIRKLKSGEYRLYSRKKNPKTGRRRNLGTFKSRAAAEKHERAVQYFKHH